MSRTRQGNTIYVAAEQLRLAGSFVGSGGGRFTQWTDELKLTAKGANRSVWNLPTWLDSRLGRTPLSYHGKLDRWRSQGDRLYLQTVAKGQEFVLDCREYVEASRWASDLINRHGTPVEKSKAGHS